MTLELPQADSEIVQTPVEEGCQFRMQLSFSRWLDLNTFAGPAPQPAAAPAASSSSSQPDSSSSRRRRDTKPRKASSFADVVCVPLPWHCILPDLAGSLGSYASQPFICYSDTAAARHRKWADHMHSRADWHARMCCSAAATLCLAVKFHQRASEQGHHDCACASPLATTR